MLNVRPAAPPDAAGLARVKVDAWRTAYAHFLPSELLRALDSRLEADRWSQRLSLPGDPVWVAVERDEVLGFAVAGPNRFHEVPCDGELHAIYVHPAAQRRGVGRKLLAACVDQLLNEGFSSMAVFVFRDNAAGSAFYRTLGATYHDSGTFEIGGIAYPDESYVWPSLAALQGSLRGGAIR